MDHGQPQLTPLEGSHLVAVMIAVAALLVYEAAVVAARRRGPWPAHRLAAWVGGLVAGVLAVAASGPGFDDHVRGHLLGGMLAPLLLALAAPVTLALRALPVRAARRLVRVLSSPPLRVVSHPLTAGLLNVGGLWVLYATGLYALTHVHAAAALGVHLHMLVAGYLFAAAVLAIDPVRHRPGLRLRAVVLFAYMAAHSVLAKWLYAHPPVGVSLEESARGAMTMYYGGDLVDVALLTVLAYRWYLGRPVRNAVVPHRNWSQTAGSAAGTGRL